MDFITLKTEFLNWSGAPRDLAHVYGGVLIQMAAAFLTRRSVASLLPLSGVLVLELLNEWFDVRHLGGWEALNPEQVNGVYWDIGLTMALPMMLFCVARFAPGLMVGKERLTAPANSQPET